MDGYTENLDDFGYRELDEAINILNAIRDRGLPKEFGGDGVKLAFNSYNGNVFLTNDDYQVCMLTDDGDLEMWLVTPYDGHEGFLEDLVEEYKDYPDDWVEEDIEYLREWGAEI